MDTDANGGSGMHVTQQATVIVPVSDQERALAFYVETLGLTQRADFEYGDGERWVEVAPPGAGTAIGVALAAGGQPGVETGVAFSTGDLEADHAELSAGG